MVDKIQKILEVVLRNRLILSYINYRAKRNRINLHWAPIHKNLFGGLWWKVNTEYQNLGDFLALPIYEYMLKRNNLNPNIKCKETKHLYTIGSVLLMGHQDAVVWGSGILLSEPEGTLWKRNKYRKLDIRCVRGPKTKQRLLENGYDVSKCVMGDPGVLMPLIYKPKELEKRKYSVIVHMAKADHIKDPNKINILTNDWKSTIDQIYNSEFIISSSLHGIILAEAYGIPAVLLDELQFPDLFKYDDYYNSTGRYDYTICKTIEEAINVKKPEVPDLSVLQDNLLKSFPIDLWQV